MRRFSLSGPSALPPSRLRAALADPSTWRHRDAAVTEEYDRLIVALPLPADAVPASLARFVPAGASLRVQVDPAAEAPAGSPQTARLRVTVPGAPVEVRVDLSAVPADGGTRTGASRGSEVTAEAELESTVPFLGPMVESALEPVVRDRLREQLDQLIDLR